MVQAQTFFHFYTNFHELDTNFSKITINDNSWYISDNSCFKKTIPEHCQGIIKHFSAPHHRSWSNDRDFHLLFIFAALKNHCYGNRFHHRSSESILGVSPKYIRDRSNWDNHWNRRLPDYSCFRHLDVISLGFRWPERPSTEKVTFTPIPSPFSPPRTFPKSPSRWVVPTFCRRWWFLP